MASPTLRPYQPRKRYIPKHQKPEQQLQRQVCSYLRLQYPHVMFRSDFASGLLLSPNQARLHSSMQSNRGWPDIMIYSKQRGYSGLAIELKREGTVIYNTIGPRKGKLTGDMHIQEQAAVLQALANEGWLARFAVGFDNAQKLIDGYFGRPANTELF